MSDLMIFALARVPGSFLKPSLDDGLWDLLNVFRSRVRTDRKTVIFFEDLWLGEKPGLHQLDHPEDII